MGSVNENTLMEVFSMLIERLTEVETTQRQSLMNRQLELTGYLDSSLLELPYDIYVHQPLNNKYQKFSRLYEIEPLDTKYSRLNEYAAFYIETDAKDPYKSLCLQIVEGKFDEALGSMPKEVKEAVQAKIHEVEERGWNVYPDALNEWECRDIPSITSKRLELKNHLIDVTVNRYLADVKDTAAKDFPVRIYHDPLAHMARPDMSWCFFVFIENPHRLPPFSFIKNLTGHIQGIVQRIEPQEKISKITICPMTRLDASTLKKTHDIAEQQGKIMQRESGETAGYPLHIDEVIEMMKHHPFWLPSPFV